MRFGEYMGVMRRAADLSQREVAEELGVSVTYLSDLENDRRVPLSADRIETWAIKVRADVLKAVLLASEHYGELRLPMRWRERVVAALRAGE